MAGRGTQRERQVREQLTEHGWVVVRAAGSHGCVDLAALKDGMRPLLVEVKSTAQGPYERFGPEQRAALSEAAEQAGATALLAYWPPRGALRWIGEGGWPDA